MSTGFLDDAALWPTLRKLARAARVPSRFHYWKRVDDKWREGPSRNILPSSSCAQNPQDPVQHRLRFTPGAPFAMGALLPVGAEGARPASIDAPLALSQNGEHKPASLSIPSEK